MISSRKTFVYAPNNRNGFLCGQELIKRGCIPKLILLHPDLRRKYGEEICSVFSEVPVVEWGQGALFELKKADADILLSVNFDYIFPSEVLSLFRYPMNLHTGYLPFNQGMHPNVWSIVEDTPAGVSLHLMTNVVDKGEIIARCKVPVSPVETGSTLYAKLEEASVELIGKVFPSLLTGEICTSPMPEGGTFHYGSEFDRLCALSLQETISVADFLRRLRALSFPPYKNAYFTIENRRVYVDITLDEE